MEITVEQRKQLLAYLSTRPYNEVYLLVAMLVSLKPKSNGKKICNKVIKSRSTKTIQQDKINSRTVCNLQNI